MLDYNLCLYVLLPVASFIYIVLLVWTVRILLKKRILGSGAPVGITLTIMSMPVTLIYIALLIPLFYFNYLLKQERYCLEVIRVNGMHDPGQPMLRERCSAFDIPALIDEAWKTPQ
jgi:hypothetical protein